MSNKEPKSRHGQGRSRPFPEKSPSQYAKEFKGSDQGYTRHPIAKPKGKR